MGGCAGTNLFYFLINSQVTNKKCVVIYSKNEIKVRNDKRLSTDSNKFNCLIFKK